MTPSSSKVGTLAATRARHDSRGIQSWLRRLLRPLRLSRTWISVAVAILTVFALLLTAQSIGYSRDESFYFDAANSYSDWYKLLLAHPESALTRAVIDAHFAWNHEHPPLMKMLFGLSHELLFKQTHWFSTPGIAFRLPSMLMAGLGVFVLVQWGIRTYSAAAGIVAGLSFALLPRLFHHAHLACFDVPVACMCVCTAYLWSRAIDSGKLRWSVALGVVYGLTLATKHNAWLLPAAFFMHGICIRGGTFLKSGWLKRMKLLTPALSMLVVGPLVLFALWPWLWADTWERLSYWLQFHLKHEYYNMEFLGVTYWKPPMPRAYAWVMTLATVPLATLVLFLIGFLGGTRDTVLAFFTRLPVKTLGTTGSPDSSNVLLWALCLFIFYAPWLSTNTPIFGGTKHWFTAYPFLCLFAARGFESLRRALPLAFPGLFRKPMAATAATGMCAAIVLAPGFLTVKDMGPWGLSTYMPIVGGASGAATLGLNRTFWGYTTWSLAPALNARARARVFVHDTTSRAFRMHQEDGALNRTLYDTLSVADSDLALYHHEPHMGRVEYQIWAAYGSATPAAIGTFEGVPVIWMYERRKR
jgi:4-amino-4-deoxy-L-arabinose transferase-like glycosyltransferase